MRSAPARCHAVIKSSPRFCITLRGNRGWRCCAISGRIDVRIGTDFSLFVWEGVPFREEKHSGEFWGSVGDFRGEFQGAVGTACPPHAVFRVCELVQPVATRSFSALPRGSVAAGVIAFGIYLRWVAGG